MSGEHFTKGPWQNHKYGYEKYSIQDERGTEIGFVHRPHDAFLCSSSTDLYYALADMVSSAKILGVKGMDEEIAFAENALDKALRP